MQIIGQRFISFPAFPQFFFGQSAFGHFLLEFYIGLSEIFCKGLLLFEIFFQARHKYADRDRNYRVKKEERIAGRRPIFHGLEWYVRPLQLAGS